MSSIRRQSIISSLVIYIGFAVGMVNTYFFTKKGLFTETEYGLTGAFIAIATMMMAFAGLGMPSYIFKFHPYYKDHLEPRKTDMVSWAILISSFGFMLVVIAGMVLKHLIVRKFGEHAPDLLIYYNWIFPMAFGYTIYTVLEAYAWSIRKPVLASYLKEVQWRLFTTVLIVLLMMRIIPDFDLFIKLFAFGFPSIALTLFLYLVFTRKIHFTFRISKVTRRLFGKILALCSFVYAGTIVFTLSQVFDTIVLASLDGLKTVGIYTLAQIMTSMIQAPQRSIVAASIPHLSQSWKDKKLDTIQRIYQRSSLNLLIFACAIFLLIWLNFTDGIESFGLEPAYLNAAWAFFLLGLTRIIDMGTGVNAQIIGTSTYWKFELVSGIILLAFMLPLTYILTTMYGITGPAIASLISITIYNTIRIIFLWKKFGLYPFTRETIYTILLAGCSYAVCYFAFRDIHGFTGIIIRSVTFILLYGGLAVYFRLSPDFKPVWQTIRKKFGAKSD
jgi:O-antigen/teichoic acid export membrane protein